MSDAQTITFREVGNNPPPDDSAVTRVDMSKSLLQRVVGKIHWPGREGDPITKSPPRPPVDPAVELPQQKNLLAHLNAQLAIVKARTEDNCPGPTTAIHAIAGVQSGYGRRLANFEDVAGAQWCDVALLAGLLDHRGEGLIPATAGRIYQLEAQLRPAPRPSEEHRRLIAAAEKTLKAFGAAYIALRKHEEQKLGALLRHEFRGPRPMHGINWGAVDAQTLRRVAEFAATLPDDK